MCVMKKPFCPSTLFFQNMPMKMEEPSCIAKCDSAPDFAKWTWRISANLGSGVTFQNQVMASRVVRFVCSWVQTYGVSTLTLPESFEATGNDVMMMSCNSLVVTIGLNTFLETWRGNW